MNKKIISIILFLVIYLCICPAKVYGNENEAFKSYQEAMQATTSSGCWTENLTMTADMSISKESAKMKTKVTLTSNVDISNYSKNDLSEVKMSGSASMNVMEKKFAWDVVYENGIAHYEYTEPDQRSVDKEMEPSCFNFNTLTQEMMEKAKVSGNKITFTIPGNKMEDAQISAVYFMSGIENLHFDDVDVEMIINQESGAIDTMIMIFHASLNYQGYDSEVDYHMECNFTGTGADGDSSELSGNGTVERQIENGLVIYSDYTNLSIQKDGIITLSVGIRIDGEPLEDVSGITFWTDKSSNLSIRDTGIKNNQRYVKFKATDVGIAQVVFSDSKTGYTAKIPVTVYKNNYLSYTLSSVPIQYIEKYPTNFYNVNGLYIDGYRYEVNDNKTATVSFDVYNSNYTYGVVEVYNAQGNLKDGVLIEKMTPNNTSIKEVLWDGIGCFIKDIVDKNLLTYRQETSFSKKTPIKVEIPENGYIRICNNPEESYIVNIVNSVDVLMSLGKIVNKIKNYDVNSQDFVKKLTFKLVTEKVYETSVRHGSDLPKDLWKGVKKDVFFTSESLGDFSSTIAKNLDELDLGKLIADSAKDFGWGVGEEIFTYFTGPIKKVFDGMFAFSKLQNISMQHMELTRSTNAGSIYIQNQGGGIRTLQQITVKSDTDFSDDTSLNVFQVALDSSIIDILKETNPDVYDAITEGTSYTYNISLLKNGEEVQPEDEVTVYVPIPKNMKFLAYIGKAKIYRVEKDGTLTDMDVKIKDGCFVFNTPHFSLYTLVGIDIWQDKVVILIGIIMVACMIIFFVGIKKQRKRKKYKHVRTKK